MSVSQAILKNGKGAAWRIRLAESALENVSDGNIYQQEGIGLETYVIHSCQNLGEPFDSAKHRAAHAVWNAVETISRKPSIAEKNSTIDALRKVWEVTK